MVGYLIFGVLIIRVLESYYLGYYIRVPHFQKTVCELTVLHSGLDD